MKKNKKPIYSWNEESGEAVCILTDGINPFIGIARCHPDDKDMMSEKAGLEIAEMRAQINFWRHIRDNELKPQLKILTDFYKSICQSKHFNENSYETKMLRRKIHEISLDLTAVKNELALLQEDLISYLKQKDIFYNRIRENRKKAELNQEE